jgi:hypothetical protein
MFGSAIRILTDSIAVGVEPDPPHTAYRKKTAYSRLEGRLPRRPFTLGSATERIAVFGLHTVGFLMIVLYFVGVLGFGLWVSRRVKTEDDYFVGGRKFGKCVLIFHNRSLPIAWTFTGVIGFALFADRIAGAAPAEVKAFSGQIRGQSMREMTPTRAAPWSDVRNSTRRKPHDTRPRPV